jgi:deoxycytidine triphosphate deaminase
MDLYLKKSVNDSILSSFLISFHIFVVTLYVLVPRTILATGLILSPYIGYLGSTIEHTETRNLFPYIDGKSSIGRNFILNHHTAGRGDDGFCGQWTLEIRTMYPTVVYPYMRIGQIYYDEFLGQRMPYNRNERSHYNGQLGPTPAAVVPVDTFLKEYKNKIK